MSKISSEKLILVIREPDGIATVTINRPASLNSLTQLMITDLAHAFKVLGRDESVRVIVLTGSGRAFCSGLDLTAAEQIFKADMKGNESDPVSHMEQCPKPIIGAINGAAVTAGFEIALACDILVAAEGTKFIDTHTRFGIVPSWGLSQKLARIIGPNKAREVSLTAKPLTAEEAQKLGFVNYVVPETELMKKAREIAAAIAKNNHEIVIRYKSMINEGFKLDLHQALALEKERAHKFYRIMTTEQFEKMKNFVAIRSSKKLSSKL
ncbi:ENOYL-COA HYDRATASE 2, enoyl-CoA hydratase/isomerase A [Hibiscus trionum]|uniref:ENOYL-COA HYDRATASE 2, enoyl-CoA hydratase/isomerase A n=1 Tax=Hibiscus trionum TaxID=183268 RepID=A0A9W7J8H4_HIBTR|nr:ENOYL-COA HYDRATASE 2, enoyl-CoA hydratase/isomerase A [Hibiscus trionum]